MPQRSKNQTLKLETILASPPASLHGLLQQYQQQRKDDEKSKQKPFTKAASKRISAVLDQEIDGQRYGTASVLFELLQDLCENEDSLQNLIDADIASKLVAAFDKVKGSKHHVLKDLLQTIQEFAKSPEGKIEIGKQLVVKLFSALKDGCFSGVSGIAGLAADTLNVLLERCPENRDKLSSMSHFESQIKQLCALLETAEDYALQGYVIEFIWRTTRKFSESQLQALFKGELGQLFCRIEAKQFIKGIREFLNAFNRSLGPKRTIFSLPVEFATYCGQSIETEWVDFGAKRFSFWMNESQPELVDIAHTDVIKAEAIVNQLKIKVKACDALVELSKSEDAVLTLQFSDQVTSDFEQFVLPRLQIVEAQTPRKVSQVVLFHTPSNPIISPLSNPPTNTPSSVGKREIKTPCPGSSSSVGSANHYEGSEEESEESGPQLGSTISSKEKGEPQKKARESEVFKSPANERKETPKEDRKRKEHDAEKSRKRKSQNTEVEQRKKKERNSEVFFSPSARDPSARSKPLLEKKTNTDNNALKNGMKSASRRGSNRTEPSAKSSASPGDQLPSFPSFSLPKWEMADSSADASPIKETPGLRPKRLFATPQCNDNDEEDSASSGSDEASGATPGGSGLRFQPDKILEKSQGKNKELYSVLRTTVMQNINNNEAKIESLEAEAQRVIQSKLDRAYKKERQERISFLGKNKRQLTEIEDDFRAEMKKIRLSYERFQNESVQVTQACEQLFKKFNTLQSQTQKEWTNMKSKHEAALERVITDTDSDYKELEKSIKKIHQENQSLMQMTKFMSFS